jgi:hypothetical protein
MILSLFLLIIRLFYKNLYENNTYFSNRALMVVISEAKEIHTDGWLKVLPEVLASRRRFELGVTYTTSFCCK